MIPSTPSATVSQVRQTEHCMVCGEALTYYEKAEEQKCIYCEKAEPGHIVCPRGHYICDACHNKDAMKMIKEIAFSTKSTNPVEIAELMLSYPGLPMLGCQHAYIAGGAFLGAIKNEGSRGVTKDDIEEVFKRTQKQAHGGYCGLTGTCGIAPALGACFAVLTGSRCGKDEEQRTTMEAVTRISRAITDLTGPSCCKAYVRMSLNVAVELLEERLGISLPKSERATACAYTHKHPHGCRETRCPYYGDNGKAYQGSAASAATKPAGITLSIPIGMKKEKCPEGAMEQLIGRAIELGAEKAKLIDTNTIVVEEWVRWKCRYGCPFYEKDAYHPPCAPDAESTKKVIKEYRKAILLNNSKGKSLTETAVKLEGEAYHMGYYKAFALTALTSGPAGEG